MYNIPFSQKRPGNFDLEAQIQWWTFCQCHQAMSSSSGCASQLPNINVRADHGHLPSKSITCNLKFEPESSSQHGRQMLLAAEMVVVIVVVIVGLDEVTEWLFHWVWTNGAWTEA